MDYLRSHEVASILQGQAVDVGVPETVKGETGRPPSVSTRARCWREGVKRLGCAQGARCQFPVLHHLGVPDPAPEGRRGSGGDSQSADEILPEIDLEAASIVLDE